MSLIITGLSGHQFSHLYGLNSDDLIAQDALRVSVDQYPGFPRSHHVTRYPRG